MQGQKLVYVVVFVLIFALVFNFTRNTLKKRKHEEKRRLQEQQEVEFQKILKVESTYRRKILNEMFKEHDDVCYKMLVFTVVPEILDPIVNSTGPTPELPKLSRPTFSAKKSKKSNGNTNINIKTGSSEPVIYLFVLVLIYSLITAASDISQHYKVGFWTLPRKFCKQISCDFRKLRKRTRTGEDVPCGSTPTIKSLH